MTQTAAGFDAARLTRLGRVKAIAAAPSGMWAAVAVARLDAEETRYVSELCRVSLAADGEPPSRLTRGAWDDDAPRFRRDGALGFLSDRPRGGAGQESDASGHRQVWLLPAAGGEPVPLTDEPLGVLDFRFAADADRLVVRARVLPGVSHDAQREAHAERSGAGPTGVHYTDMPVRFWDHWLQPAAPHFIALSEAGTERRDLTPDAGRAYEPFGMPDYAWAVSADGRAVVAPAIRPGPDRIEDRALHRIDVETGAIDTLGAEERTQHGAPIISGDGTRIACWRQARKPTSPGRRTLWLFDGEEDRVGRAIARDWDAWPTPHAFSLDGGAVVATADVAGAVPVHAVDIDSGEVDRVTSEACGGSHGQLSVAGDRVVGVRHRLLHPPEPFEVELAPGSEPRLLARLSGFASDEGEAIARWESFSVAGDGGDAVQSFLVLPQSGGFAPHPALVWIHGGPVAQNADGWHWRWNPLVPAAAGYAVALPNPRGSTGCGQAFIDAIWNNAWGGACYRDVLAVADAIADRGDIDAGRVAAMGGSFGGYMANWIGANTDRFRCLVSHAGIYNLSAFHGTTDYPSRWAHQIGGPPDGNREQFERYSPHRVAHQWKTPTLIIHGERDYRVPISEALLLFEDLTRFGVDAELLVFPDENHWILKPRNTRQWYGRVLEFLERHMAG